MFIQQSTKFFWGSSTSSHQIEGHNHNDWSQWEEQNAERLAEEAKDKWQDWQVQKFPAMLDPKNYISGQACDHYNRFAEDFDLAKSLGHNAHRFSLEWSRIEPEEGKFNQEAIEHYRQVILALKRRGLEPFVTIWHWTLPCWLKQKGGIASLEFPQYFAKFTQKIALEFSAEVKFWITINEPTVVVASAYLSGAWPPQKKCPRLALRAYKNLLASHNLAYDILKKANSSSQIGFANNLNFMEPYYRLCLLDNLSVWLYYRLAERMVYKRTAGKNDFLALQYYFHNKIRFPFINRNKNKRVNDLGWEIYPKGLYELLKRLKKYNLPIYITENGLADQDDSQRGKFIQKHIFWMNKAIKEGVDVRGYFYWSLLDNFEWDKGFWPRFGLIEVDYQTQKRTIRKSAIEWGKRIKLNF